MRVSSKKGRRRRKKGANKMKMSYHHTRHQIMSAITKFRNDNAAVKERIHLLQTTVPIKARVSKRIQSMRDKEIELKGKVRKVKNRCKHLERTVEDMEKEIAMERSTSGGVHYLKQERHKVQYQLRVLENRLEQVMSKYNQSLANNRKLKQSIGTIREEKQTFERIYQKMEKELCEWKAKISELIESSNTAFEAKDESMKDVDIIKDYKKGILQDLTRQFKAMDRLADKTETIQEQIRRANEEGNNDDRGRDTRRSSVSVNTEDDYRVYTPRKSRILNEDDEDGDENEEREGEGENVVLDLPSVFHYFEQELGLQSQELVESLEETENQNFSLYVYYDELHNEITNLQSSIDEMKDEIHNYERGEIKKEERKMNRMYQQFQKQISEAVVNSKLFEDKVQATSEVIESLIEPLRGLFDDVLHCDRHYVIQKLGEFKIRENNLLLIMALVEGKIDNVLSYYHWKGKTRKRVILKLSPEKKKSGDRVDELIAGSEDRKRIQITPPSSLAGAGGQISGLGVKSVSELEEPLTIEEMSLRLKRMI